MGREKKSVSVFFFHARFSEFMGLLMIFFWRGREGGTSYLKKSIEMLCFLFNSEKMICLLKTTTTKKKKKRY